MIKEKEADVLHSVLKTLSAFGVFAWRSNNMGVRRSRGGKDFYTFAGIRGVSDIIAVHPHTGQIICIECKATGKLNQQSHEQAFFQHDIERNGGIYLLVDNYEQIIKWIEENIKKVKT
jgi:hypothetical protein